MKRSLIGWIAAAVLGVAGAAFAYVFYFAGGSGEPSTALTTPEVITTTTSAAESTSTEDSPSTTSRASGNAYVIDPERSTASFEIDEVLRGDPTTVVGSTDDVAGQVVVSPDDLRASQFSEIVVNARTFETDSNRRNRAIRGPVILDSASDEHELITFTPTSIEGADGVGATPGETYELTVTGDLTIKGTTNPVTFDVTVDMVDETTIEGTATTEVMRTDYEIGIPSVSFVADVSDEVTLTLEFIATHS